MPANPKESLFLWGPRQTGKSTLLRQIYGSAARFVDLLKSEEFAKYIREPSRFREECLAEPEGSLVVVDEVQKVPQLLDEIHWLIENHRTRFVLCGSSARKLKRGHANLLGGRAMRHELFGLTAAEMKDEFQIVKVLNTGYLPRIFQHAEPRKALRAYVADYLKEEIAAEGLVRNLPVFSRFMEAASFSDAELVNFSTIARDCGVSVPTIKGYFEILTDTMIGRWLPAHRKRAKRRVIGSPKFYFFDVGVVNNLAKRREVEPRSELFGKAFENWVHHELVAHLSYSDSEEDLSYWRLASGIEVDFIIGDMRVAIEAKGSGNITSDHLRGLRALHEDFPGVSRRIVVSLENQDRKTDDGIEILSVASFLDELKRGGLIA